MTIQFTIDGSSCNTPVILCHKVILSHRMPIPSHSHHTNMTPNKHSQLAIGYRNVSIETHTETLALFSSENLHCKTTEKHVDAPPLPTPHSPRLSPLLVRR